MSLPTYILKEIINSLGYELRQIPQLDGAAASARPDPITHQYLQTPATADVKLRDVRGLFSLGLPLAPETHPFVRAALAAREGICDGTARRKIEAVLERYYQAVRPSSALEAIDLEVEDAPGLCGVAVAGWVFPWSDRSVEDTLVRRQRAMRLDALQYGRIMPADQGFTAFGPAGERKLELESLRLAKLVCSVAANGFRTANRKSPMQVVALRRDGRYRWLVAQGHHRFAVCAAFSVPEVAAVVRNVVRREDAEFWPQVAAGIFTKQGALALFDRLYEGRPAEVCRRNWTKAHPAVEQGAAAARDRDSLVAAPACARGMAK